MAHHFLAQLTPGGGPDPEAEIEELVTRGGVGSTPGRVLFGTRSAGTSWTWGIESFAVIFYRTPDRRIRGVVAEILMRHQGTPALPPIYAPWSHAMQGWWALRNVRRLRDGLTLADIPGRSSAGDADAATTFAGSCTFAYWTFDRSPTDELCAP